MVVGTLMIVGAGGFAGVPIMAMGAWLVMLLAVYLAMLGTLPPKDPDAGGKILANLLLFAGILVFFVACLGAAIGAVEYLQAVARKRAPGPLIDSVTLITWLAGAFCLALGSALRSAKRGLVFSLLMLYWLMHPLLIIAAVRVLHRSGTAMWT